ncbi:sterol desaturase family protein [Acidomonas methanolica]|uniref:sterol desaturase family protein n=1 Tax=Acidomonas methanolica TaxID=437 RepID=UPI00211A6DD1|nr:sterol desaturase family protein [Acidomonas methanolica]MCQ9154531.1 sterol desaturase family protein [Acidomonas methanolica]
MSVRLFQSAFLERLTFMPMRWFLLAWIIVLGVVLSRCAGLPPARCVALAFGGLALWTLTEYAAHRHLFHLHLSSGMGRRLVYLIHGNHHADPGDRMRNMMPLIVTLPLSAMIWSGFVAVAGRDGNAVFLGFALGYFLYDLTHYAAHQWRSGNKMLEALRRHHLRHHYGVPDANFAITAIFWDRVFGTQAPRRRRR